MTDVSDAEYKAWVERLVHTCLPFELEKKIAYGQPLTKDGVYDKLARFGGTDYVLSGLEIELDDGAFIPVRVLNELRRMAIEMLLKKILEASRGNK